LSDVLVAQLGAVTRVSPPARLACRLPHRRSRAPSG
jgi:hypothetical protein